METQRDYKKKKKQRRRLGDGGGTAKMARQGSGVRRGCEGCDYTEKDQPHLEGGEALPLSTWCAEGEGAARGAETRRGVTSETREKHASSQLLLTGWAG